MRFATHPRLAKPPEPASELEQARQEAEYYRHLATEAGARRLREAEITSELIARIRSAERNLAAVRDGLELRVAERTAELRATNDRLSREIAERGQMEARLRAIEGTFRSFMDHFPGLAYIKEEDGTVVFVNEGFRTLLGLDPAAVVGRTTVEAFPGKDGERMAADDAHVLATGDSGRVVERVAGRTWATYKFRIPWGEGRQRLGGLTLDITEQERAEEGRRRLETQLQQNQKLESLGVLAGGIAHDFNNLLTTILGNLGLARGQQAPGSELLTCLADAENAAQTAAELCRQMLAYSGRARFVSEPLDLNEVIRGTLQLLRASVSKRTELTWRLAPALPALLGDPTQLRQVLLNLVINGSEAIGAQDGVVQIGTGAQILREGAQTAQPTWGTLRAGRYVWLEVADTGCGIDEAIRDRIFEPFYSTKFTGRGLGLSAVLGIVRGMEGAIELESAPGRGACFRVWFPVPEGELRPVPQPLPSPDRWRGGGRILLVDDEEGVRRVGTRILARLGFETITAGNGREALDVYREQAGGIRAVMLDLTMPQMDGVETLEALRAIDPGVVVLVASGFAETEIASRFRGIRPDGFIEKPFTLEQLRDRLRQLLERSRPEDT